MFTMLFLEKIKKISLNIATFGRLGRLGRVGGIIASVVAFPLIFSGKFIYEISPQFFWWMVAIFSAISFFVVFLANLYLPEEDSSRIIYDEVIGVLVAFIYVPLAWKIMVFGFILFHIINFLRPFLFCNFLGRKIENLPLGIGIFAGDLISGLVCNLFLQLMVWVMA